MAPRKSWLEIPAGSHFSLENIPFGIISTASSPERVVATVIGSQAIIVGKLLSSTFDANESWKDHTFNLSIFSQPSLNAFAALGREKHRLVRTSIQNIFDANKTADPSAQNEIKRSFCVPLDQITNHLPFQIGDYTDFYVGLHHAMNCGLLMRGPGQELQPNYKHLPVGYHGRASSVVVSGTPIVRPSGQILPAPGAAAPIFSACRKLDFELELGCFVCSPNKMGEPVRIERAEENLFGVVLMNDWSARDIQTWEMVPLGPFNAKNFGTSVSPWVVTMDALEPFLVPGLESEREVLPYLKGDRSSKVVDINLEVQLKSKSPIVILPLKPVIADLRLTTTSPNLRTPHNNPHDVVKPALLLPANARSSHRRGLPLQSWGPHWLRDNLWYDARLLW
jgi:fumarylacetoacetase